MTKGEGVGERRADVPIQTQKNGKANGVCGLKTADFAPRLWYNSRVRPNIRRFRHGFGRAITRKRTEATTLSGFFGVTSKKDCVFDLFYGTDYHSHLGTRRGGDRKTRDGDRTTRDGDRRETRDSGSILGKRPGNGTGYHVGRLPHHTRALPSGPDIRWRDGSLHHFGAGVLACGGTSERRPERRTHVRHGQRRPCRGLEHDERHTYRLARCRHRV